MRVQCGFVIVMVILKIGDSAKVVDRAKAVAQTRPGTVGVKVSILSPYAILTDKLVLNKEIIDQLRMNSINVVNEVEEKKTRKKKK